MPMEGMAFPLDATGGFTATFPPASGQAGPQKYSLFVVPTTFPFTPGNLLYT